MVITGADERVLDEVANKLKESMEIAADGTDLPEGVEFADIFVEDPDAPDVPEGELHDDVTDDNPHT